MRDSFGNPSIFAGSYGWASAGRFHHAQTQVKRLLNLVGGFTGHRDTYSYGAGAVIARHVLGSEDDFVGFGVSLEAISRHTELGSDIRPATTRRDFHNARPALFSAKGVSVKRVLSALGLFLLSLLASANAAAQSFPTKPVTIVVPYLAGGSIDVFSRALSTKLSSEWRQPVVILNKSGANEAIAADFVAKSAPDGHTLLIATESALTMNPHLYKKLAYNPLTDLAPVSRLVHVPMVLFASPATPARTLPEFIQYARSSKQSLNYGSTGAGGIVHIPLAMLAKQENLNMVHVPYKGAAALVPDTISGVIDVAVLAVSNIEPYVKTGKLKALAISAKNRSDVLPDVPTFKEAGVKDIDAFYNIGLLTAKGTPPAIAEKIAADIQRILFDAEFKKANIDPYAYVAIGSNPAQYKAFIESDYKAQGEKIKALNVALE